MRKLMLGLAAAAFAVTLNAQQLEVNNAGASLTRAGVNPTPGTPFQYYNGAASFDFRVSGAANSGYILLLGTLANPSTQPLLGFGIADYLDLDQSLGIQVLGDGISFSSGLQGNWFITGNNGQSNWVVPANPSFYGTTLDFQAIVSDVTAPPFNLNFTAAARYAFSAQTVLNGDDAGTVFTTAHTYPIYGAGRTQFNVSTNGFIRCASNSVTDLSETAAEMIAGNLSASATLGPVFALMWDDLNMPAAESRNVFITENTGTNTLTFAWVNGRYFSPSTTTFGNMTCTITDVGGLCQVTYDFSAFAPTIAPSQGLVGVSDGSATTVNNFQAELVTAGAVNPYVSTADFETYFQIFSATSVGAPPIQPIDVQGTVMTWLDTTGNGNWLLY